MKALVLKHRRHIAEAAMLIAALGLIELFLRVTPSWLVALVSFGSAILLAPLAIYLGVRESRERRRYSSSPRRRLVGFLP